MQSAFGVDHGVSKSLVNGQWVKATKLSGKQRKAVGGYKKAKGVTPEHQQFKAESAQRHRLLRNAPAEQVRRGSSIFEGAASMPGAKGFGGTVRLGSAKGGRSVVGVAGTDKKAMKGVLAHERAHAAPRRSEYRMHGQILKDPKKLMREEARADMTGGAAGHYTKQAKETRVFRRNRKPVSVYAGSAISGNPEKMKMAYPHLSDKEARGGIKAYKKTQNKIARAQGSKTYREPLTDAQKQKRVLIGGGAVAGGTGAAVGGKELYNRKKKPHA